MRSARRRPPRGTRADRERRMRPHAASGRDLIDQLPPEQVAPDGTVEPIDAAFGAIVATIGARLRCEMRTLSADTCRRDARWRVDLHGCEQVNMCGQHKSAWVREMRAQEGNPRCAHCGHEFDSLDDAVRITAI